MANTEYETLHLKREFDAPRQAVWEAWTQPEQFAQWYAPQPYTIPVCEFDLRPGGKLKVDMKSPEGWLFPSVGEFKTVEQPERLAFTNSPLDKDGNKLFEVLHTVTLTEEAGKTLLEITSEVLEAGPDSARYLTGMRAGLSRALDQLGDLVKN
jgi:uncharacterized protein YndB with AHSA1/START domain